MECEKITREWLESLGFKYEPMFAMVKTIVDGPEDSSLAMSVGNWPWNAPAVSLLIGGYSIVLTEIWSRKEIVDLLQLLSSAQIDHPDVYEVDEDGL